MFNVVCKFIVSLAITGREFARATVFTAKQDPSQILTIVCDIRVR